MVDTAALRNTSVIGTYMAMPAVLDELDAARARIVELERIVDAAREAAACAGDCVMTVAGCQTHNWDDPCAMAELRAAMRGKDGE